MIKLIISLLLLVSISAFSKIPYITAVWRDPSCDSDSYQGVEYCYRYSWEVIAGSPDNSGALPSTLGDWFGLWSFTAQADPSHDGYLFGWDSGSPRGDIHPAPTESWNELISDYIDMDGEQGNSSFQTLYPPSTTPPCIMFGIAVNSNDRSERPHPIPVPGGQAVCAVAPPPDKSCSIKNGNTTIDYGLLSPKDANGARASGHMDISCDGASTVILSPIGLDNRKLPIGPGIEANILVNGKDIADLITIQADSGDTPIDIESILNVDMNAVETGQFSGDLIVLMSYQ